MEISRTVAELSPCPHKSRYLFPFHSPSPGIHRDPPGELPHEALGFHTLRNTQGNERRYKIRIGNLNLHLKQSGMVCLGGTKLCSTWIPPFLVSFRFSSHWPTVQLPASISAYTTDAIITGFTWRQNGIWRNRAIRAADLKLLRRSKQCTGYGSPCILIHKAAMTVFCFVSMICLSSLTFRITWAFYEYRIRCHYTELSLCATYTFNTSLWRQLQLLVDRSVPAQQTAYYYGIRGS
jgi:hypothetical protein